MGFWLFGIAIAVLGLVGLFMASFATDAIFYGTGLALFAASVIVVFILIRRSTGPKGDAA